jgi:hypothetical protein
MQRFLKFLELSISTPQIDLQFTPLKQKRLFTHNAFFAKLGCHEIGTLCNGKKFMVLLT